MNSLVRWFTCCSCFLASVAACDVSPALVASGTPDASVVQAAAPLVEPSAPDAPVPDAPVPVVFDEMFTVQVDGAVQPVYALFVDVAELAFDSDWKSIRVRDAFRSQQRPGRPLLTLKEARSRWLTPRFQSELAAHQRRCMAQHDPDDATCDVDPVDCAQDVLKPQAIALRSGTASAAQVKVTLSDGKVAVVTVKHGADGWKVDRVKCPR